MKNVLELYLTASLMCITNAIVLNNITAGISEDREDFGSLTSCVKEISKNFNKWSPTTFLKIENNSSKSKNDFFVSALLALTKDHNIPMILTDKFKMPVRFDRGMLFIIFMDDCAQFKQLNGNTLNKSVKYLIVADNFKLASCENEYAAVFKTFTETYDFSMLLKLKKDHYVLYSLFLTQNETCKEILLQPKKVNVCTKGLLSGNVYFGSILQFSENPPNYMKCPIKVGIGESFIPYTAIEDISSLNNFDRLDVNKIRGLDIEVIKIIFERYNATYDLLFIRKPGKYNKYLSDYSDTVLSGELDVATGVFFRNSKLLVPYTGPFAREKLLWIYTAEPFVSKSWSVLFISKGFYVFVSFYFGYSIIWYIVSVIEKHAVEIQDTLLYNWGGLLGASALPIARSLRLKFFYIFYLILCLHLTAYLSSQLYAYYVVQELTPSIKTIEELISSKRALYFDTATKYLLTDIVSDGKYANYANTAIECNDFEDCLRTASLHDSVTIAPESVYQKFITNTSNHNIAKLFTKADELLIMDHEIMVTKNSPLLIKLCTVSRRLYETGIVEKLKNNAQGLFDDTKKTYAQEVIFNSNSCERGCKISLKQLLEVFSLWLIGCIISIWTFILENAVNKFRYQITITRA